MASHTVRLQRFIERHMVKNYPKGVSSARIVEEYSIDYRLGTTPGAVGNVIGRHTDLVKVTEYGFRLDRYVPPTYQFPDEETMQRYATMHDIVL